MIKSVVVATIACFAFNAQAEESSAGVSVGTLGASVGSSVSSASLNNRVANSGEAYQQAVETYVATGELTAVMVQEMAKAGIGTQDVEALDKLVSEIIDAL